MKSYLVFAVMSLICTSAAFADESTSKTSDATQSALMQQANSDTQKALLADDNHLKVGGLTQFRYNYTNNDSSGNSYGFSIPRARIDISGELGEGFSYRVSPFYSDNNSDSSNGNFTMQDAWGMKSWEDFKIQFGQFRPQFMAELNGWDEQNIALERSVIANTLGQTYTQGVQLAYKVSALEFYASFNDGLNYDNTPVNPSNNNYAITSRLQYNVINDVEAKNKLSFGGGVNYQDFSTLYTVDGTWELQKLMLQLEYVYNDTNVANSQGIVGTVAYFVTDKLQPYLRYEYGSDNTASSSDLQILYVGANYYLLGKAVKLSGDFGYSFSELSNNWNYQDTGWSSDTSSGSYMIKRRFKYCSNTCNI